MLIYTSDAQEQHWPKSEFFRGSMVPCFELPMRVSLIRSHLEIFKLGTFKTPRELSLDALNQVHSEDYLQFIQTIHQRWCQQLADEGQTVSAETVEIIPHTFPARNLDQQSIPTSVYGQLGYYAMDTATPITAGAYAATRGATLCAVNAVQAVFDQECAVAFSLSRPPGHHASVSGYGGYCFYNHAAVAAQHWLNLLSEKKPGKPSRIAILDVDFHHCNGTQQIFYQRDDVMVVSLHGDPDWAYPYFLGRSAERGEGAGEGANLNLPLAKGTDWQTYQSQLQQAIEAISDFAADGLIVSFGADTHEADPISGFRLTTDDYRSMGAVIGQLDLPTAVVMEGGYAINILGAATCEFLQGLQGD